MGTAVRLCAQGFQIRNNILLFTYDITPFLINDSYVQAQILINKRKNNYQTYLNENKNINKLLAEAVEVGSTFSSSFFNDCWHIYRSEANLITWQSIKTSIHLMNKI